MERSQIARFYQTNGYAVIEDFLTASEVEAMRSEIIQMLEALDVANYPKVTRTEMVSSDPRKRRAFEKGAEQFWLGSNNKARFFFEPGALDSKGELAVEKAKALNKVGHGLHLENQLFHKITFSRKIKTLVKDLGYLDPVIVQGQYIFKQPNIGTAFSPHMDATYLYVEPVQNLGGLWFALDDATIENGCLAFVPGSHRVDKVDYRFLRNPESDNPLMKFVGTPRDFKDQDYVMAPVKKGACVVIHGLVMHKSSANTSDKSRHAYTVHFMERNGGTKWAKENWLEENFKFPRWYSEASA